MRGRAAAASRKRQAKEEGKAKQQQQQQQQQQRQSKRSKASTTMATTKSTKGKTKSKMLDDDPAALPPPSLVGPRGWIDRTELIRLLQQALSDDLGLEPVARALAAATGVEREPPAAAGLRESVSRGDWARVPALFAELGVPKDSPVGRAARFVAFREAYLEVREKEREKE